MAFDSLSAKQRNVLDFLIEQHRAYNTFPSYREIAKHIGQEHPNAAARYLKALHKKGYLDEKEGERGYMLSEEYLASLEDDGIPLLGYITAGGLHPIVEMENEIITLDDLVGKGRDNVYALKVDGDSMIEANILDGDIVFIKRGERPRNGEIGVVAYDGETTLKYVFFERDHIRLVPANDSYTEIKTKPSRPVEFLGTYVGHVHLRGGN